VIHDGVILQLGNHASLVNIDGAYANMYKKQLVEKVN